jgi:hypothetical protein
VKDSNFETVDSRDRDRSAAFKQLNPGDLFRWAAVPSHPPFEAPRDPPFGGWCERRDARTFRLKRVLKEINRFEAAKTKATACLAQLA